MLFATYRHYIPATAAHFVRSNTANAPGGSVNLKGVAIGNGLTDVANQFGTYAAFAEGKGLISHSAAQGIQALWLPCQLGALLSTLPIRVCKHLA